MVPRAVEAASLLARFAADGPSRSSLARAYSGLVTQRWDGPNLTARLRLGTEVLPVTFRRRDIYIMGEILHEQAYRLRQTLPADAVILDAGANIGMAALWLRAAYPGATLHCIEPSSANFAVLRVNVGGLPRTHCVQAALGFSAGDVRLALPGGLSDNRVVPDGADSNASEVVSCITGADYLERAAIDRLDLLKLDVEGLELEVLRGLAPVLPRVRGIVGEVHERLIDAAVFYAFLDAHGYEVVARRRTRNSAREGVHMFEAVRREGARA